VWMGHVDDREAGIGRLGTFEGIPVGFLRGSEKNSLTVICTKKSREAFPQMLNGLRFPPFMQNQGVGGRVEGPP
jgi:hypothetical protein